MIHGGAFMRGTGSVKRRQIISFDATYVLQLYKA